MNVDFGWEDRWDFEAMCKGQTEVELRRDRSLYFTVIKIKVKGIAKKQS